jgi:hypothetical protein
MKSTFICKLRSVLLAVVGTAGTVTVPSLVHAESLPGKGTISPGLLFSLGSKGGSGRSVGGQLSGMWYPSGEGFGYGAFFQGEHHEIANRATYTHLAIGTQLGWFFGLKLGAAYLGPTEGRQATWAAQFGPYLTAGYAAIGMRALVPLALHPEGLHPPSLALVITLQWPFTSGDHLPSMRMNLPSGRPLTTPEGLRVATLAIRNDWQEKKGYPMDSKQQLFNPTACLLGIPRGWQKRFMVPRALVP